MNDHRRRTLQRVALMTCLLTAAPLSALAQACSSGAVSEIIFNRGRPFRPAETAEDAFLGGAFRALNSVHVASTERTIRWEILFAEEDCFDPLLLQESARNLRNLVYIAEAEVESEQLADGSHRVTVTTVDAWALSVNVAFSFDGGFTLTGFSASAKNLLGTGTSAGYFRNTFRERRRAGGLARQPNVFGTGVDATLHGGNTRSGWYYSESLFHPFKGEVGRHAFRQAAHRRDDYFPYSVESSLGFTQALVRFQAEQYEATYQRRFGDEVGTRFLAGIGLSREVVRFPFGAAGGQIVLDDDFDAPTQAPAEVLAAISPQARDHATNRVSFTIGVRALSFSTKARLDALAAMQDIQLGSDLSLTVAPGFRTGDDNVADLLTRAQGNIGIGAGNLYLRAEGDFQARRVSSDDDGGPTGWRDVLLEIDGTAYWTFSENSTLFGRVLYTAGYKMDRPFQLTLGGREGVRGYDDDSFPGSRRIVATLEQRLPGLSFALGDLGLAGFVDAGKVWAGRVPYGADSDWEASVGVGLRFRMAAAGHNVLRADFGVPVTGQRGDKGVTFRLYAELFGLLDRRAWPTQTARSRWYGIDPELTTRPLNPLAGN